MKPHTSVIGTLLSLSLAASTALADNPFFQADISADLQQRIEQQLQRELNRMDRRQFAEQLAKERARAEKLAAVYTRNATDDALFTHQQPLRLTTLITQN